MNKNPQIFKTKTFLIFYLFVAMNLVNGKTLRSLNSTGGYRLNKSLNVSNGRPIGTRVVSPINSQSKVSSITSLSSFYKSSFANNMRYYSPQTYGKSKNNNKTYLIKYISPTSSSTPATTTTTITTTTTTTTTIPNTVSYTTTVYPTKSSLDLDSNKYGKPMVQYYSSNDEHSENIAFDETPEREFPYYGNDERFSTNDNGVDYPISSSDLDNSERDSSSSDSNQTSPVRTGTWLGPGIAGLIIGILPITILIASMIPAIVSIPTVSAAAIARRRRQISDFESFKDDQILFISRVLEILSKYGISSLEDPKCMAEMFCRFAVEGKTAKNNLIQTFFHLIDLIANRWAEWMSVDTLFYKIKQNKCENIYKCLRKHSNSFRSLLISMIKSWNKFLINY